MRKRLCVTFLSSYGSGEDEARMGVPEPGHVRACCRYPQTPAITGAEPGMCWRRATAGESLEPFPPKASIVGGILLGGLVLSPAALGSAIPRALSWALRYLGLSLGLGAGVCFPSGCSGGDVPTDLRGPSSGSSRGSVERIALPADARGSAQRRLVLSLREEECGHRQAAFARGASLGALGGCTPVQACNREVPRQSCHSSRRRSELIARASPNALARVAARLLLLPTAGYCCPSPRR